MSEQGEGQLEPKLSGLPMGETSSGSTAAEVRETAEVSGGETSLEEGSPSAAGNLAANTPPTDAGHWSSPVGEKHWDLADLGLFVLFALGTMVVVGLAVIGGFKLLNSGLGWHLSLDSPGVQTPVAVLVQVVWELLWLGFIYQIVVVKCGLNFWKGLKWELAPVSTGSFLLFGFALSIAIQLFSQLLPKRDNLPIEQMFDTPASAYLLAFFGIVVAPFMEELVFRGFVFPVLERRWGVGLAVLVTGSTFAAIHAPQLGGGGPELGAMLAVGLILSLVRARTGSLKPSFLVHLGYNSSLFILLFVTTNRFQTLSP